MPPERGDLERGWRTTVVAAHSFKLDGKAIGRHTTRTSAIHHVSMKVRRKQEECADAA